MKNYAPHNELLSSLLDKTIDTAVAEGRYLFSMEGYLTGHDYTRKQTKSLLESTVFAEVKEAHDELSGYIRGDSMLKEAYGFIPKAKAKKTRDYFKKIITQAEEYYDQRKPGRKLGSKNKSKRTK